MVASHGEWWADAGTRRPTPTYWSQRSRTRSDNDEGTR